MKQNNKVKTVGYVKASATKTMPIYKYSGMCVVSKTAAVHLASRFKIGGNLANQLEAIKTAGFVMHRDFFTVNRQLYTDITGSAQLYSDTILITTRGLKKLAANPRHKTQKLVAAIKLMEDLEQKLFPKTKMPAPEIKITPDKIKTAKLSKQTVHSTNKQKETSLVLHGREDITDRILDKIVTRVLERLAL